MNIYRENSKYSVLLSIVGRMKPRLFFATKMKNRKKKNPEETAIISAISALYHPAWRLLSPFRCSSTKTHVSQRSHWQWFYAKKTQSAPWLPPSTVHLNHIHHGPAWLGASEHWKESPTIFVTRGRVRKSLC